MSDEAESIMRASNVLIRDYKRRIAELERELAEARTARLAAEADAAALVESVKYAASYALEEVMGDGTPVGDYLTQALATHGERGRKLLAVVNAARQGPCRHSADHDGKGCPLCQALAALDAKEPAP